MKPTWTIDDRLLDNAGEFNNSFFNRFHLRTAPAPLPLTDTVAKDYLFPTLYGDVTCAIGIFMCSYEKAKAMMPHPLVEPVRMPLGRSLVAFSCYIYRKVLGVTPYNEIAMTIPVLVNPGVSVPVLPMIAPVFSNFGYYVFSMPVTSLENRIRGREIWGLPKDTQEIDIRAEGDECVTTAYEENGPAYFELRVPMTGKPTSFDVTSNLYSRLGDRFLQSETNFKGTFAVNKHMGLLFKKGARPAKPVLSIGTSPSGQVLRDLEIEEHPFQFRYCERMSSCFDLPNPNYRSPIQFS